MFASAGRKALRASWRLIRDVEIPELKCIASESTLVSPLHAPVVPALAKNARAGHPQGWSSHLVDVLDTAEFPSFPMVDSSGAANASFVTDLYLGSCERTAKYCAVCSFAAEASLREVSRRRPFPNTGGHTSERKQRVP